MEQPATPPPHQGLSRHKRAGAAGALGASSSARKPSRPRKLPSVQQPPSSPSDPPLPAPLDFLDTTSGNHGIIAAMSRIWLVIITGICLALPAMAQEPTDPNPAPPSGHQRSRHRSGARGHQSKPSPQPAVPAADSQNQPGVDPTPSGSPSLPAPTGPPPANTPKTATLPVPAQTPSTQTERGQALGGSLSQSAPTRSISSGTGTKNPEEKGPWWKRHSWIWGVIGGAVLAGGVTAGVVVGTSPSPPSLGTINF